MAIAEASIVNCDEKRIVQANNQFGEFTTFSQIEKKLIIFVDLSEFRNVEKRRIDIYTTGIEIDSKPNRIIEFKVPRKGKEELKFCQVGPCNVVSITSGDENKEDNYMIYEIKIKNNDIALEFTSPTTGSVITVDVKIVS